MMTHPGCPLASPMLVLREESDNWAILFDPDTGHAHGVNPVGVFIWKHLDGMHTVDEIILKVRERCTDAPFTIDSEVNAFVDDLVSRGYVRLKQA